METEDEVYDSWDGHYCGLLSLTSDRIIRYKNIYKKRIPTGTNTEKEISTSYNYSYDANGNITGIYKNCTETNYTNGNRTSGSSKTYYTRYTYDYLNQLIREDDEEAGYSYTYEYDNAGNRTVKKRYAYTLGTLGRSLESYGYSYSSSWGDRLVYSDEYYRVFTYDAIGNPILIEDSEDPEYLTTLTWDGRLLTSLTTGNPDDTDVTYFTYNADGIRISKEHHDDDVIYRWEYDLSGTAVIRARYYIDGELTKILLFMYDENGSPFAMSVKDASSGTVKTYYYEKNLQGDIVGIMNEAGYKVVSYTYDAWGNPYNPTYVYHSGVSAIDRDNAELNPFRYRGYYYDSEAGYYYLRTRYYNPEWGRFINADSLINQSSLLGYNSFAYCLNNPINRVDPNGKLPRWIENIVNWVDNNIIHRGSNDFSLSKGDNKSSHDANRRPYRGEPGSTYKAPNGDSRTYGPDGTPEHDYDHDDHKRPDKHPHDPNGGHNHDWKDGVRGPAYSVNWEAIAGAAIVTVCVIGIAVVVADDVTGAGVADDVLIYPLITGVGEGLILIFG